ncbi:MAG: chemotaxis protein CheX [Nitrospinaceae bacterium]|jgi:CheY-specific phosphatase CheX|nr:chemotaxis protein CheX [Nitrospina sp.]MBT5867845.1 chemotaxis protein CheX [Nitrospinaceae bacterium]MBT6345996.1 chemotaxis protein CheX [Nitrospina sp.]
MENFESEICQYTENIWKSILELDVKKTPDEDYTPNAGEDVLAGCVHISGQWEGTVTLDCTLELAKKVASIMFKMPEDEVPSDLIQDALGELTNMTGGNIKSLLPEPCFLSLPAVTMTQHGLRIPGSETVSTVTFKCWGFKFKVSVLKKVEQNN